MGGNWCAIINTFFIPVYGYRTAAVSTLLSYFVYLCLSAVGSRKELKWYIKPVSLLKITVSCAAMSLYLYLMKQILPENLISLAFLVISGAVIYLVTLLISGELKDVTVMFGREQRRLK
jgi:peptidoglycan biosynthesis protein MviN/MurJ (putative lipid II flippase)